MKKLNEKIREKLNKWFKQQRIIKTNRGELKGYFITKSQEKNLKKDIWRFIRFKEEKE